VFGRGLKAFTAEARRRRENLNVVVGAKKLFGTVFHVSPVVVKHKDVLNNSFAQHWFYYLIVQINLHLLILKLNKIIGFLCASASLR